MEKAKEEEETNCTLGRDPPAPAYTSSASCLVLA